MSFSCVDRWDRRLGSLGFRILIEWGDGLDEVLVGQRGSINY